MGKLTAAVVAALTIAVAGATPALPRTEPTGAETAAPAAAEADLNGDGLFDDLAQRLAGMATGDRLSVIVTLRARPTGDRISALERALGSFQLTHRFEIIPSFVATMTKAQIQAAARAPAVAHVEENSVVRAMNDTAQASFGVTKARTDAGVDGNADGNASTYSKNDLVAAVIDSGIDGAHHDLDGGKVIGWKDFVNNETTPYDDFGHGTHVAATLAGEGDSRADRLYKGVAPGAALVGVKVLDAAGYGSLAGIAEGVDWVVQNKGTYGIEAINLSAGTSTCSNGTDAASAALNNAVAAGLVVAVSAGNNGPKTCSVGSPSAAANVISVGAMADLGAGGFKLASFSSRGPTVDGRAKPDLVAPGVDITSADAGTATGYRVLSGTSMASPFVAGVALLMLDENSGLTPQQVKDKLTSSAVDWARGGDNRTAGTSGRDNDYGAGRLDAYAAIRAAGAGINSPPAGPVHQLLEGTLPATGSVIDVPLVVSNTQFPIAATMMMANVSGATSFSTNFNLYLLNPSGTQVAASATSSRQEDFSFTPTTTGSYTLRIKSSNGSGPFFVDVSAGLGAPPPPPPPPPPPGPDTTPPTVSSVSPADGATTVPTGTGVSVTFSEAMDKPATQSAFSLLPVGGGSALAGNFSWSGNTMTFTPSAPLVATTQYTAKVSGGSSGASDVAGNRLAADKVWGFTTAAGGTPAPNTAYPSATVLMGGTVRSGTYANLTADDNSYFEVNANFGTTSWYGKFTGLPAGLRNPRITYKGKNSASCTQSILIWNWRTSAWVVLNSQGVGSTEVEVANLAPPGAVSDVVSVTGETRVRVACSTLALTYASADLLKLTFDT